MKLYLSSLCKYVINNVNDYLFGIKLCAECAISKPFRSCVILMGCYAATIQGPIEDNFSESLRQICNEYYMISPSIRNSKRGEEISRIADLQNKSQLKFEKWGPVTIVRNSETSLQVKRVDLIDSRMKGDIIDVGLCNRWFKLSSYIDNLEDYE
ncbi:hypothetical protein GJ496_010071 [Pomphorhynchus laevis]|nr:hypothetical protein GJ496_010071 [Pomphorhynchus laevis]